jgi:hypothetical protein
MGDLDPTDRNVIPLRRGDSPDEEERKRLASTIFAEPDEIGTFSQGNLVPPQPRSPDQEDRPSDPFFDDRLSQPAQPSATSSSTEAGTGADDYFAQLSQQSASEMAEGLREHAQPDAAGLPGSAQLPAAVARVRHRAWLPRPRSLPARVWSAGRDLVIDRSAGSGRRARIGAHRRRHPHGRPERRPTLTARVCSGLRPQPAAAAH